VSAGEAILPLSWPIDFELTVGSHGWAHLAPWSWDPEDFVKTVLTINASWYSTCRMDGALVTEPGTGGFPGPEAMHDYGDERLRERALSRGHRRHGNSPPARRRRDRRFQARDRLSGWITTTSSE
jgi:hypothetical protein